MTILNCFYWHLGVGAGGGLAACIHQGVVNWPRFGKNGLKPGVLGDILIGAVAAGVVWGLDGPAATLDLGGVPALQLPLSPSQLVTSLLIGFGGGKILTLMSQKKAEQINTDDLAKVVKKIIENKERES